MLEAGAKLSAGMATGVSAPGDEPKPTLPAKRLKSKTNSELIACAIFSEGRVAFEHRRFDRSRTSCENDDWFRDLAADRGRRQIVPIKIYNEKKPAAFS